MEDKEQPERRRAADEKIDLIVYRLDKLEYVAEKLTANQELLTKMEVQSSETTKALVALQERQDYHGRTFDKWSERLATEEEKSKELAKRVDNHTYVFRGLTLLLVAGFLTAIWAVI